MSTKSSRLAVKLAWSVLNYLNWPFPGKLTAAVAVSLTTAELALLAYHRSGFWQNSGLSLPARLGLAGIVLLCSTFLVWSAYWYFLAISLASRRITVQPLRRSVCIISAVPLVLFVDMYLACWIFFWRLGVFPDPDALYFAGLNANMLANYFWQAERSACFLYLTILGLMTAACVLAMRTILKRFDRLEQSRNPVFRQVVLLLVGVNAAYFSADLARVSGYLWQLQQDRIEAVKNPRAPYSFELCYHVNPAITLIAGLTNDRESGLTGEIPLDALTPLGSIRPPRFPNITPENRRNIILITIESLRSDAILMEHQGQQVMPHLAELARNGHHFPNCYAVSTHSDYCDPCILSSLYPLRRTRPYYYRREDPWPKVLIYDLLKQYGYATAIFSSQNEAWSNMHLFYESPNLDVFFDSRAYKGETIREKGYFTHWMSETGQIAGKLDDAVTLDHAIKWMHEQRKSQTPFFVSLNLQTSHFPYERPDGKEGPFQPGKVVSGTSFISYELENIHIIRNAYYNALAYIDTQIGRLVDSLEAAGLRDRTIILIAGDHGEAFGENGVCFHAGYPVETVIKTGLVVNCPGLIDPVVDEYLAQTIDIVPTATGLLGILHHPAHQGLDLRNSDRPPIAQRLVFIHCCSPPTRVDAVISGAGWKYIITPVTDSRELYYRPTDLEKHPNLLKSETDVADRLDKLLAEWCSRQLLYYQQPRYYNWFNPPRPPKLTPSLRRH